jgi:hypothetical protein
MSYRANGRSIDMAVSSAIKTEPFGGQLGA